jgi:hypothetical protein
VVTLTTTSIVGDFAFRTICERHGFRVFVGKDVQFALDYYECPGCVAEQDDGRTWQPCCSHANTDCCGHDEEMDTPHMRTITLVSSNYCNHQAGRVCYYDPCRHRECNEPPF